MLLTIEVFVRCTMIDLALISSSEPPLLLVYRFTRKYSPLSRQDDMNDGPGRGAELRVPPKLARGPDGRRDFSPQMGGGYEREIGGMEGALSRL